MLEAVLSSSPYSIRELLSDDMLTDELFLLFSSNVLLFQPIPCKLGTQSNPTWYKLFLVGNSQWQRPGPGQSMQRPEEALRQRFWYPRGTRVSVCGLAWGGAWRWGEEGLQKGGDSFCLCLSKVWLAIGSRAQDDAMEEQAGTFVIFTRAENKQQREQQKIQRRNSPQTAGCNLGGIDGVHLSVFIFTRELDCWQVYRIIGLIGCLCFTRCK